MVEQKRVDFSKPREEPHQLSLVKRTPQEIIEGWGFHEDRKMMQFNSRMKSKILMAAMVNKTADTHQKNEKESADNHVAINLKTEESYESQGVDDEQLILKEYLLQDVKPNHHWLVNFSDKPFDGGCLALAQLDHQQAQNQMENWSAQTFAALKNHKKT